jgi:methyl-accepting chemotaxis protein
VIEVKKNNSKITFSLVMIILFIITVIIVTGVLLIAIYHTQQILLTSIAESQNEHLLIIAKGISDRIEELINEIEHDLTTLTKFPEIQKCVNDSCTYYMQILFDQKQQYLTSIKVLNKNGILEHGVPKVSQSHIKTDYSREEFFQRAKKIREPFVSEIIEDDVKKLIYVTVPIYENITSAKFTGVLVASLDLKTITKSFISPIKFHKTGYAFMLDDKGTILQHPNTEIINKNIFDIIYYIVGEEKAQIAFENFREMVSGKEGAKQSYSINGKKNLIAYAPVQIGNKTLSIGVVIFYDEIKSLLQSKIERYGFLLVQL